MSDLPDPPDLSQRPPKPGSLKLRLDCRLKAELKPGHRRPGKLIVIPQEEVIILSHNHLTSTYPTSYFPHERHSNKIETGPLMIGLKKAPAAAVDFSHHKLYIWFGEWFNLMNRKEIVMKSLTLHSMDDQLAEHIRRRANEMSISMNELAKRILAEGLGIKTPAKSPHKEDFAGFCGTWSESDAEEFSQRVADLEKVDLEDWQ